MRKLLLEILRCALWGEQYGKALPAKQFRRVLGLADEQTVFGLVFGAMQKTEVEGKRDEGVGENEVTKTELAIYEAVGFVEQIKLQNIAVNRELADFTNICGSHGKGFIVVKGQTIGMLYKQPLLRQSGDIDFLVQESYDDIRVDIGEWLKVRLPDRMLEREVGFDRNDVRYELHTCLREWAKSRHQKVWDELMEKEWGETSDGGTKGDDVPWFVEIEGQRVRTLSPTVNGAYVFIHLFFHLIREGVSLRQFCDWAMVLHHYGKVIDRAELAGILGKLDMTDAYRAFGCVLVDDLGLPASEFPFVLDEDDRKWHDKILHDVFEGGNFGANRHHTEDSWKYKMETMGIAFRNSFRYYRLCPSEVGGMIPRLVKVNLKLLFSRTRRTGSCFIKKRA